MDPRRFLTLACAGLALEGCATLQGQRGTHAPAAPAASAAAAPAAASSTVAAAPPPALLPQPAFAPMAPIPNPPERAVKGRAAATPIGLRGLRRRSGGTGELADTAGRGAIASANREARESSRSTAFVGGVQVFAYDPGRLYEVWTAPLRVTTLSLAPGETIVSKAAGDTVRWQIGETTSGQGAGQRAHVMIKPLRRGLETNLVLTTNQRVYLVELKSGAPETFNAAVAWDLGAVVPPAAAETAPKPEPLATPAGPLDARFRIEPRGRRPTWTPTAVMTDGVRTFLTFPADLAAREAPALFVVGPGGETQLVNYRQQGGLWVVDRVFDAAELRVGDKRPQIVRIVRSAAGPP